MPDLPEILDLVLQGAVLAVLENEYVLTVLGLDVDVEELDHVLVALPCFKALPLVFIVASLGFFYEDFGHVLLELGFILLAGLSLLLLDVAVFDHVLAVPQVDQLGTGKRALSQFSLNMEKVLISVMRSRFQLMIINRANLLINIHLRIRSKAWSHWVTRYGRHSTVWTGHRAHLERRTHWWMRRRYLHRLIALHLQQ